MSAWRVWFHRCDVSLRAWLFFLPVLAMAASGNECFRLFYAPDTVKARACFEREVPRVPCQGEESADLARMYLGGMYIAGQGGPVDFAKARGLFTGCVRELGLESLLKKMDAVESGKEAVKQDFDFCRDIGGSTLTSEDCNARLQDSRSRELEAALAKVGARLDGKGKALLAANRAWTAFVKADSDAVYDNYRGGTLAPVAAGASEIENTEARMKRLRAFADYRPGAGQGSGEALNAAYQKVLKDADAQHRRLVVTAERAWIVYRDAEAALYASAFAGRFGQAVVEADVKSVLTAERTRELSLLPDH